MSKAGLINHVRQLRLYPPKLTQQELADQLGVTRQTIIAIENGRYAPSLALALKIARLMEKPVEEIFLLEDQASS
ncbi:MAG: helix-turn-helix transcriptional regulator [Cohaesibacteraceae bacterium]|nr:helix-turn-helix transcriptional regulator [Cohaesibacteraceae bacterium]